MTRQHCRECGVAWWDAVRKPHPDHFSNVSATKAGPILPPASAWAAGPPLDARPAAQASVLTKAAAAARAAGAPEEALSTLAQSAADAQRRAEEARPAGRRLDAAEKRLRTAEAAQRQADGAVRRAVEWAAKAKAEAERAAAELTELRAELVRTSADTPPGGGDEGILPIVRELLEALEQAPVPGHVGNGPCLPARTMAAVTSLRQRLGPTVPDPPASAAPEAAAGERETLRESDDQASAADSVMSALEDIDDADEAALAAIARR